MKSLKFFFLFLFCLMTIHVFAQKPGYFGKRFIAGGEFSYGYDLSIIPVNIHYGGSVDYIVGRKFQIGFNYFRYNAKIADYNFENARITGYTAMFKFRFYRAKDRGAIAPIGKYLDFGFSYSGNKYKIPEGYENIGINFPDDGTFLQFHAAAGIQTVVFDCITADCGIRTGFPPLSLGDPDLSKPLFMKNIANFYTRIGYMF